MSLKVVTLNLLIVLDQWEYRAPLIVSELSDLSPDIVLFQEASMIPNTPAWIASQLTGYQFYLAPDAGMKTGQEGLAIFSRLPVTKHEILDLGPQNRKAQIVRIELEGSRFAIANTHLFWHDGHAPERVYQAELILNHLKGLPENVHRILGGDFNDVPNSPTIQLVKTQLQSAYQTIHGEEPKSTFPTPLQRSWRYGVTKNSEEYQLEKQPTKTDEEHTTIDYIFASQGLSVMDCQRVFEHPDPAHPEIYPSDHYGLMAILEPAQV